MRSSWRLLGILAISLGSGLPRPQPLHAQNNPITITGRVTNDAGAPLSLASVYIETLGLGTQTADDGRYQLLIPAARIHGQQVALGVRAIGFRNTSSLISLTGTSITKDFQLAANPLRLGEVVVTGSGTSTTVEKLGNTINSVKSEEVQKSNEPNLVNALAAKAPGVEVTSQAGDPGAGSSIIIRGLKTIQGDGQPLFVIDGQPIDNSTLKTGDFADAGTAYTNRAADINPNDIESIEILKGAAASAKSPVLSEELSIGWPSMTNSGWPSPSIVLRPRMMIDEPAPGSPACDVTSTPGAFAASAFTMFDSLDFWTSSAFTELMVFPSFSTVVDVPDPVTTTSPNRSGFAAS